MKNDSIEYESQFIKIKFRILLSFEVERAIIKRLHDSSENLIIPLKNWWFFFKKIIFFPRIVSCWCHKISHTCPSDAQKTLIMFWINKQYFFLLLLKWFSISYWRRTIRQWHISPFFPFLLDEPFKWTQYLLCVHKNFADNHKTVECIITTSHVKCTVITSFFSPFSSYDEGNGNWTKKRRDSHMKRFAMKITRPTTSAEMYKMDCINIWRSTVLAYV